MNDKLSQYLKINIEIPFLTRFIVSRLGGGIDV